MDLVLLRGYVYTLWRLCFKKKQIPRGKESTKNLLLLVTFFPSSTFTFALAFPYRSSCVIFLDNKVAKKFRKLLFRDKIKKATFIHFFSLSLLLSLAHRYSSIHENTIFQTSSYLNINSNRKMSQKGKKKIAHNYPRDSTINKFLRFTRLNSEVSSWRSSTSSSSSSFSPSASEIIIVLGDAQLNRFTRRGGLICSNL